MSNRRFPKYPVPTFVPAPERDARFADEKPTAITLFSGLGSSSKALRDLGYDVLAHDFMPEAVASLGANGFDAVGGDIRQVDFTHEIYADVEVVVGGPPCQPFSQNGRNAGEDDPRDMIPDFQRCVAQTLPKLFILENVRGLAGPRHRDYLARRVAEFEALGYVVDYRVLDAADYGTPQSRKRLFVIGIRADVATPPWGISWPAKVTSQTTMAEALGWDAQDCFERNQMAPEAAHCKPSEDRNDLHYLWPMGRPAVTVVGSFMPEIMAAPGYRNAGDGPRQNAPGSVYTTQTERLVLQDMPADWNVCGSKTKVDLQIGNSCPNRLLRSLVYINLATIAPVQSDFEIRA